MQKFIKLTWSHLSVLYMMTDSICGMSQGCLHMSFVNSMCQAHLQSKHLGVILGSRLGFFYLFFISNYYVNMNIIFITERSPRWLCLWQMKCWMMEAVSVSSWSSQNDILSVLVNLIIKGSMMMILSAHSSSLCTCVICHVLYEINGLVQERCKFLAPCISTWVTSFLH